MNERRGDLAHRYQDKIAKMQSGMRQREEFCIRLLVVVEEKIEIDRARLLERFVFTPEKVLDPKHTSHHLRRGNALAMKLRDHVEKVGLALDLDGLGLIDTRKLGHREAGFHQSTDGEQEIAGPIA